MRLRLFGAFHLDDGDGGDVPIALRKGQAMLAYLALKQGFCESREVLGDMLWSDRFKDQAQQSLRQTLFELRLAGQAGCRLIESTRTQVRLGRAVTECDVWRLESLAKSDNPENLAGAAEIYDGPLLDVFAIRSEPFEQWLLIQRSRCEALFEASLLRAASIREHRGEWDSAIEALTRLLERKPLSYSAVTILMRIQAAAGDMERARDTYNRFAYRLKIEIDESPPDELRTLYGSLKAVPHIPAADRRVATPAATDAEKPALAVPDKPSIAVLPFQNINGDPEQEYFADGIVDDIVTGLARLQWLFVIARNSSFVYKGKTVDLKQIGRHLGVRYLLEGSVRKGGNRLRINCQLIEAESGAHLWADKFDGALEDVFDLQDKITEAVVALIEPNLQRAEIERARRKRPESLDAYDLYLRALPHFQSLMPEDANIGMRFLEKALKLDPDYAVAHAFMAWGFEIRVLRGDFEEADAVAGVRHARQALSHGTDDPTTLAVAALVILLLGHDFDAASGAIARALSLNGSCALALYLGAYIHSWSGDPALAEDYASRALRLSPFDPRSWEAFLALGLVRLYGSRFDEAAAFFAKAIQANPRFSSPYAYRAAALSLAGREDEARSIGRRLLELEPNFRIGRMLVFLSRFGRPESVSTLAAGLLHAGLPE